MKIPWEITGNSICGQFPLSQGLAGKKVKKLRTAKGKIGHHGKCVASNDGSHGTYLYVNGNIT